MFPTLINLFSVVRVKTKETPIEQILEPKEFTLGWGPRHENIKCR